MWSHIMLTERIIKATKPTAKHQFLADDHGLYLRVHPSGTKQFVYRSRVGGKARWFNLGVYPTLSLLDARKKALELAGSPLPEAVTVAAAAESYRKNYLLKHLRRPDIPWDRIVANVLPVLGERKIASLKRADIFLVLQPILDRGSNRMANSVLGDCKQLCAFAVERGWAKSNVALDIRHRFVGGPNVKRDRVASDAELVEFIHDLMIAPRMSYPMRLVLGLLLLTGQRVSDVLALCRKDVAGPWWTFTMGKTQAQQKVYLSVQARILVEEAFLVFGDKPFSLRVNSVAYAVQRHGHTFTPHDLRRTMATRLSDLGVMPHVVEKLLGHRMQGVMAVYNRSEYLAERKAAWQLWGRYVNQLRKKAPGLPGPKS